MSAVRDAKGTLVQYRGLILDITDQKNSSARRASERARFQLEHPEPHAEYYSCAGCAAGKIGYVNHRAAEIGYSVEALRRDFRLRA